MIKKTFVIQLVIIMLISAGCILVFFINKDEIKERINYFTMESGQEAVQNIKIGWNLGNSLECTDFRIVNGTPEEYETAWGNPKTTEKMINEVKKADFRVVRIPVSWGQHMGVGPEYLVDKQWMSRVKEVVNYVCANNMYAIIDVHHDGEWCIPTYKKEAEAVDKLSKLWTQIAEEFKEYDEKLIFEIVNEPRLIGTEYEWTGGTKEAREIVNHFNEAGVKAIRKTGGNNIGRNIIIQTYGGSGSKEAIEDLKVPKGRHVIVSIHAYIPTTFAMDVNGTDKWGTEEEQRSVVEAFESYYNTFVKKGIPVIIGEFGSINKDNLEDRVSYSAFFIAEAKKKNLSCIIWDNNRPDADVEESFGLLNRENLCWYYPEIIKSIIYFSDE